MCMPPPTAFPWEGEEVPASGPHSSFCWCSVLRVVSYNAQAVLSTAEVFLEAPSIYDSKDKLINTKVLPLSDSGLVHFE